MGACNSCEKTDDTRFWRFEESPCGDEPTAIRPVSAETRRAEPGDLKPQSFPSPIINLQNAPPAPDPTGLGAAFSLLGTPNLFKDITGLDQNQKNALAALSTTMEAAKSFGSEAAKLMQQKEMKDEYDKTADRIKKALDDGLITKEQASNLTNSALKGLIGENRNVPKTNLTQEPSLKEVIKSGSEPGNNIEIVRDNESIKKTSVAADEEATKVDILSGNPPILRAFGPDLSEIASGGDITGITILEAKVSNAPTNAKFRWSSSRSSAIKFTNDTGLITEVIALEPGMVEATFEVIDPSSGKALRKATIALSVPQFVKIEESENLDEALSLISLLDVKEELMAKVRKAVDFLMRTVNVRTIWRVRPLPFGELPDAFDDGTKEGKNVSNFLLFYLRNESTFTDFPKGLYLGKQSGPSIYSEVMGYDMEQMVNVHGPILQPFTEAVLSKLQADPSNVRLKVLWTDIVSRIIAQRIAIGIFQGLLGPQTFNDSGFNKTPIPGDILNSDEDKEWFDWTAIRIEDPANFPEEGSYVDEGMTKINNLTPVNQKKADSYFPVPPNF